MTFSLSKRSCDNLVGVDERLVAVVKRAIQLTPVDFAVIEGIRTPARQREMFNRGASQIREGGKHVLGHAVDLAAFLGNRVSWEVSLYDEIADAMRQSAIERGVAIRWGGAWNVPDIRSWSGTMESAMTFYIDARRQAGQRPFIDAPHFELA